MLQKGASLVWVSAQLGHSSPQVTLDNYAWALPQGEKTHANLLDAQPIAKAAAAGIVASAWPVEERARLNSLQGWSRRSDLNRGPADYETDPAPNDDTPPDVNPHKRRKQR